MFSLRIPDLNGLQTIVTLLNVDVDWKVGIHVSHLVLVALCYTRYQVVDDRLDCSEGSDILPRTMVDFDSDGLLAVLILLFRQGKRYGDV